MRRNGILLAIGVVFGICVITQSSAQDLATPFARRAEAMAAQDELGWRLAITAYTFHKYTLFETIDKCVELGVPYLEGLNFQTVSAEIPKMCDPSQLTTDELAAVRKKLDDSGVRMITYFYQTPPADEVECRKVFEFAKALGVEFFLSEPDLAAFDTIDKLCDEYGMKVALHNHDEKASPNYWCPDVMRKTLTGRGLNFGVCGDMGYWVRAGIIPRDAVREYGADKRLFTLQVHDLENLTVEAGDAIWGQGTGELDQFLETVAQQELPVVFGVEYSRNWEESMAQVAECIEFFDEQSIRIRNSK